MILFQLLHKPPNAIPRPVDAIPTIALDIRYWMMFPEKAHEIEAANSTMKAKIANGFLPYLSERYARRVDATI